MRGIRVGALFGASLLGVVSAQNCDGADGTDFVDAADLVCRVEAMVNSVVNALEEKYADIDSDEGGSSACVAEGNAGVFSCDVGNDAWNVNNPDAKVNQNSINPTTGSCTRLDANFENIPLSQDRRGVSRIESGRTNTCSSANPCDSKNRCQDYPHFKPDRTGASAFERGNSHEECRCVYDNIYEDSGEYFIHYDDIRKEDYLQKSGCISSDDLTRCVSNMEKFGISLAEGVSESDPRALSEICGTNSLIYSHFQPLANANPQAGMHFQGFQESGMYRIWPSVYECRTENVCSGCSDPRFRGWYASAASGPKDIILVLDDSGSMNLQGRLGKLQVAARWVINTLTQFDYVTIVRFTGSAESATSTMVRATPQNKAKLVNYIQTMFVASGSTNMEAGLELAFDLLDEGRERDATSGCTKIVLFLTDGLPDDDTVSPDVVIQRRNTADVNARVFTYSLGDDSETKVMKRIACENRGVWQLIKDADGDNLKTIMAGYYTYLAAGVADGEVRWSDWFEDGEGGGQIAGVCSPVYDRFQENLQGVPVLFGVTCVGVHRDTLENLEGAELEWMDAQARSAMCPDLELTEESLEILRGQISSGSICSGDDDDDDGGGGAGVAIGLGVAGALLLFCGLYLFCKKNKTSPGGGPD